VPPIPSDQGRRQKNFQGRANGKKDRKIAKKRPKNSTIKLSTIRICTMYENPGRATPPRCRHRPCFRGMGARRPNSLLDSYGPRWVSAPENVRTGLNPSSPLSVRTHHKFWKIRTFLHQKVDKEPPLCPRNVHTGTPDVFYGQWTSPYIERN